MNEQEIVKELNKSFKMTRGSGHVSKYFKTLEDFYMEYSKPEVDDAVKFITEQGAS